MAVSCQLIYISPDDWEDISASSYDYRQIGSFNLKLLYLVWASNQDMHCMFYYVIRWCEKMLYRILNQRHYFLILYNARWNTTKVILVKYYTYTLSSYHHQIGSMNYYPLFRVRSWNNGVRCMSFCILMNLRYDWIASWGIRVLVVFAPNLALCHWHAALLPC